MILAAANGVYENAYYVEKEDPAATLHEKLAKRDGSSNDDGGGGEGSAYSSSNALFISNERLEAAAFFEHSACVYCIEGIDFLFYFFILFVAAHILLFS